MEDILGKTSVTRHDDTKQCISQSKRSFKTLPLGPLLGVHSKINAMDRCTKQMPACVFDLWRGRTRETTYRLSCLPSNWFVFPPSFFPPRDLESNKLFQRPKDFRRRFTRHLLLSWSLFDREIERVEVDILRTFNQSPNPSCPRSSPLLFDSAMFFIEKAIFSRSLEIIPCFHGHNERPQTPLVNVQRLNSHPSHHGCFARMNLREVESWNSLHEPVIFSRSTTRELFSL